MNAEKVIEIHGLSYRYPDGRSVLKEIDLEIHRRESVAILGPNGAGKSTLLYHLNGTLIGEGRVEILGLLAEKKNLREIRRRVGVVFQNPRISSSVQPSSTMWPLVPSTWGCPGGGQTAGGEGTGGVGLTGFEERSAHHLSEGEKKRVALATILAMDTEILALDEPTDNLDPAGSRSLVGRIRLIHQTKVIVTHHLPLVLELCERAVLLEEGKKIGDLSTDALVKERDLLERFGFDAELAQWWYGRMKQSGGSRP